MIEKIRSKIDRVDEGILKLLNERVKLAIEIGKIKSKKKEDIFVPLREKEIISNLKNLNKGPITGEALSDIFREILNVSRSIQKKIKVSYFGPAATFTHLAAIKIFGRNIEYIPVESIKDVFTEVEKGRAVYGVVPIENSTEGVVNHTLDMFVDSDLKITSEIFLEISHYLLSNETSIQKIKKVYSHPQAIAQTRNWIEKNLKDAEIVEVASTSEAARLAKKEKNTAAISSVVASEIYGLNILAENIEDYKNNFTRFLVIGRQNPPSSEHDKTSIMFSVKDRVGALHDMLVPFKKYKLNLTKIESRPTRKKAWEYIFFVDFLGHINNKNVVKALAKLEKSCSLLKVLGSYPIGE
ncbi:MAG: prephenate dehydratase [Elusimicrobiota bacterium]|nr:prephenate dehydratase [Elusimicrobiota bacterium]